MFAEQAQNCTQQLVNFLDEAIIAVDGNHQVVFINHYGSRIFGREVDETIGLRVEDLVPIDESEFHWKDVFTQIQLYGKWQGVANIVTENDEPCQLDMVAFTIEDNEACETIIVARKWTQWEVIQSDLKETWEKVKLLARSNQKVFAKCNYELRTSLNSILGMSNLILETAEHVDQKRFANGIQRAARLVLEYANGLSDVPLKDRTIVKEYSDQQQSRASAPTEKWTEKKKPVVLVVEDNPVNQMVAVKMLQNQGCDTRAANNGEEAISILENEVVDLIFMDVEMPVMDGFETTEKIRSRTDKNKNIPIVALTANAQRGDRERCLVADMDEYISKPVQKKDMVQALRQWLNYDQAEFKSEKPLNTGSPETYESSKSIFDEDPDFVRNLIDDFIRENKGRFESLRKCLNENDCFALQQLANSMLQDASKLGADRLRRAAGKVVVAAAGKNEEQIEKYINQMQEEFTKLNQTLDNIEWESILQD